MHMHKILILAALGVFQTPAFAAFHQMKITEVLTGANGNTSIQYVELEMQDSNENFVSGHHLVSRTTTGSLLGDYTIPSDVQPGTFRKILLATQAFADLGVVTPDFILPPNFMSPNGGQVSFTDSVFTGGTVSYAPYSGSGANGTPILTNSNADNFSLTRIGDTANDNNDFQSQDNTPRNNNNVTGHIPPPAAIAEWALYY